MDTLKKTLKHLSSDTAKVKLLMDSASMFDGAPTKHLLDMTCDISSNHFREQVLEALYCKTKDCSNPDNLVKLAKAFSSDTHRCSTLETVVKQLDHIPEDVCDRLISLFSMDSYKAKAAEFLFESSRTKDNIKRQRINYVDSSSDSDSDSDGFTFTQNNYGGVGNVTFENNIVGNTSITTTGFRNGGSSQNGKYMEAQDSGTVTINGTVFNVENPTRTKFRLLFSDLTGMKDGPYAIKVRSGGDYEVWPSGLSESDGPTQMQLPHGPRIPTIPHMDLPFSNMPDVAAMLASANQQIRNANDMVARSVQMQNSFVGATVGRPIPPLFSNVDYHPEPAGLYPNIMYTLTFDPSAMPKGEDKKLAIPVPQLTEKEPIVEDGDCVICNERIVSTVIVDCGHSVLCLTCANDIVKKGTKECPVCRKTMEKIIKLYGNK